MRRALLAEVVDRLWEAGMAGPAMTAHELLDALEREVPDFEIRVGRLEAAIHTHPRVLGEAV